MNKHLFFTFMILVSCVIFFSIPVSAEKIIVLATPIDDSSPGSVVEKSPTAFSEVIKIDQSSYGLIELEEALKMTSSINYPDYGGAVTAPLSLRGSNFQQTLIMRDGIPITPVTGDIVDLSLYSIPEIEQVEIIKGSNSSSFGKSAMGGAVNIVTKNPTFENSASFTSSQGSYCYSLYNALFNTHFNDTGIMLNLSRSSAENDFLYEKEDGSTARRLNNDTENISALSKIQFDLDGWDTMLTANLIDQENGSPGGEGGGWLTPNDQIHSNQSSFVLDTQKMLSKEQLVVLKTYRLEGRTHSQTDYAGDVWNKQLNEGIDLSYLIDSGIFSLSPGATIVRERINSDDYGIHSRSTTSGYLDASAEFKPVLLSLGLRYDNSTDFDGTWTYHLGASLNVRKHLDIRANIGTGYREPSMGHLYTPSTWLTFIQNPDLRPEKSFSWDIGPSLEYDYFGIGASYYVSTYKDLIKTKTLSSTSFTYENVDKAKATGLESYIWIKPIEITRISANYSLNRFHYASGLYESKTLKHTPEQVFNLQLDVTPEIMAKKTDIFVAYQFRQGVYTNEENTDKTGNRNIMNAGISVNLTTNASMSFKANNLFDDTSVEYKDTTYGSFWYPVVGRTYRFSIQLNL